jgi:hypothetical protein
MIEMKIKFYNIQTSFKKCSNLCARYDRNKNESFITLAPASKNALAYLSEMIEMNIKFYNIETSFKKHSSLFARYDRNKK